MKAPIAAVATALVMALSAPSFAPEPPSDFTIPGAFGMAPVLRQALFPDVQRFYQEQLARALWVARSLPPEGQSPDRFLWEGNRLVDVEFYVTAAMDPVIQRKRLPGNQVSGVALSIEGPKIVLQLYYLFDRIYFLPDQRPKKGAFLELCATVAYQVHGIVPFYLRRGPDIPTRPVTARENWRAQLDAQEAMIAFLQRLRASDITRGLTPDDIARFDELVGEGESAIARLRCQEPK